MPPTKWRSRGTKAPTTFSPVTAAPKCRKKAAKKDKQDKGDGRQPIQESEMINLLMDISDRLTAVESERRARAARKSMPSPATRHRCYISSPEEITHLHPKKKASPKAVTEDLRHSVSQRLR